MRKPLTLKKPSSSERQEQRRLPLLGPSASRDCSGVNPGGRWQLGGDGLGAGDGLGIDTYGTAPWVVEKQLKPPP